MQVIILTECRSVIDACSRLVDYMANMSDT